jgi:hypothetical protein
MAINYIAHQIATFVFYLTGASRHSYRKEIGVPVNPLQKQVDGDPFGLRISRRPNRVVVGQGRRGI